MTQEQWLRWSQIHSSLFCLGKESVGWLDSIKPLLIEYTFDELRQASQDLVMNRPEFMAQRDHPRELIAIINKKKTANKHKINGEDEHNIPVCLTCNGVGMVIVPHPSCVYNGEYVRSRKKGGMSSYYTMAVFCSCTVGFHKYSLSSSASAESGKRPMSLADYERNVTDQWREMMQTRSDQLVVEAISAVQADEAEKARMNEPKSKQLNQAVSAVLQKVSQCVSEIRGEEESAEVEF